LPLGLQKDERLYRFATPKFFRWQSRLIRIGAKLTLFTGLFFVQEKRNWCEAMVIRTFEDLNLFRLPARSRFGEGRDFDIRI